MTREIPANNFSEKKHFKETFAHFALEVLFH